MVSGDEFLSTGSATLGWAFGATRRGAQHAAAGTPCQDAFALWSGSFLSASCIAVAAADGHGDEQCDRSATGAALAVRAAVDELVSFFQAHAPASSPAQLKSDFRSDFPRRATRRWRSYVAADREAQEEIPDEGEQDEEGSFSRYGTTLLAALVTDDVILLGRIGDGDIRLVRPSGEIAVAFRPDPAIVGSATHSLAARDAHLLWQTATFARDEGAAVLLVTDGLPDSFGGEDNPEYTRFVASLLGRIREFGIGQVAASLPAWLDHYSRSGSGDDMTLVLARINPVVTGETEEPQDIVPADREDPVDRGGP
jgi:serine/threonine protein phosphatase PrpC